MRRRSLMSSTSPHTNPPASTDRSCKHGAHENGVIDRIGSQHLPTSGVLLHFADNDHL